MTNVTLKKASELTGKSKRTIQRYTAIGRLSYTTNKQGFKVVDIAELIRVFGELSHPVTPKVRPSVIRQNSDKITLTSEQLKAIVKEAVSEAIKEVMPLLLEQKEQPPAPKHKKEIKPKKPKLSDTEQPPVEIDDYLLYQRVAILFYSSRLLL